MMLGAVSGRTASGESLGPIRGATVSVSGLGSRTTDKFGAFRFDPAESGNHSIEVSAPGYYPGGRAVSLAAGQTRAEYFALTLDTGEGPLGYNLQTPRGKHFIEGLPGNISFALDVDWRGSPGTVRYRVGGNWRNATVTNLSASRARATLTVPIPSLVAATSGLHVEVTNGEGIQTVLSDTGVWFYPQPEMLTRWFGSSIRWKSDFSHSRSGLFPVWDLTMRGAPFQSTAAIEYGSELAFDPEAGSLFGWRMGKGLVDLSLEIDGVRLEGTGHLLLDGKNTITLRGDQPHLQAPSWKMAAMGRPGVSAPVVRLIPPIFPPAAPVLEPLLRIPGVRDLMTMQRIGLYKKLGLELRGTYEPGQTGGGFLGATGVDVTGTMGLEAQLAYELWRAKAGVYVGGEGSPTFAIYPELAFRGMEFRAYVGAFASAWFYRVQEEIGVTVGFGDRGEPQVLAMGQPVRERPRREPVAWEPVGPWMQRWGEPNRLPRGDAMGALALGALALDPGADPTEARIMENVLELAAPALVVTADGARILFAAYDGDKPWHASTDIGQVLFPPLGGGWSASRLTDNLEAEFFPAMATTPDGGILAAWSRVVGDASDAEGPEDIDPLLEIAASRFDPLTGEWDGPELLTNTPGTVSRDPLPVAFGGREGVLYVQNEGDAIIGGPVQGDSLMFVELDGAGWGAPQELWFATKGIVEFAFAEDGDGNGHVVFVVDEDGDLDTTEDWRLYIISATAAGWQSAALLTETDASDSAPALVSPGGAAMCVWNRNGTLHYSALEPWNPRPVHGQEALAGQAPTLAALTMPGGTAIAYTAQFETEIDIVAAFYDVLLDRWSLPIRLTRDEHAETAISMAWDGEANELALAYLKTQTLREDVDVEFEGENGEVEVHTVHNAPQPGRTDLYVLRHALGRDLAVEPGSLRCDPPNPSPASQATLSATVLNHGELSAGAEVAFYAGDPAQGTALIAQTTVDEGSLLPGGAAEVSALWAVPVGTLAGKITVVVDPGLEVDDRNRANNSASLTTVLPDLALVRARDEQLSASELLLTATVKNKGAVPPGAAFAVYWRADSPTGDVVAAAASDPVLPGASRDVSAVWAAGDAGAPGQYRTLHLSLVLGVEAEDFDASNHVYSQSVRLPYANGAETVLEIAPTSRSHGGEASTGNEISVIANVAWTAVSDGGWIEVTDGDEGQGQGTVTYSVEANYDHEARTGSITVSGGGLEHTFEVTQAWDGGVVLSYSAGPGGAVVGDALQMIPIGDDGEAVEAVPHSGYRFEQWSDGHLGSARVDEGVMTDLSVQAQFVAEIWTLSVLGPEGQGSTSPTTGNHLLSVTEDAEVAALPSEGWKLDRWLLGGVNAGSANPIIVESGADDETKTLQAVFVRQTWMLTVLPPEGEGAAAPAVGNHAFNVGENAQVTALPADGWVLAHWLLGGEDAGGANPITVASGADGETKTLQAIFVPNTWTLAVLEPHGRGATAPSVGDHAFGVGVGVEAEAFPAEGWAFGHWLLDDADAGIENPIAVPSGALQQTKVLRAVFVLDTPYVVVDVSAGPDAVSYPVEVLPSAPEDLLTNPAYKSTKIVLRRIPAGTFTMGSPEEELSRYGDENLHQKTLTKDFAIGVFQVTQAHYQNVTGGAPSLYQGAGRPVERASWSDLRGGAWPGDPVGSGQPSANTFVGRLRARTGLSFDLPTESQWEYAGRAGTATSLNTGVNHTASDSECPNMNEAGRYAYNLQDGRGGYSEHTVVGHYLPNNWGLYDMHGNVGEWCLDWYAAYPETPVNDYAGPATGVARVARGGYWSATPRKTRSATRSSSNPTTRSDIFGARLALSLEADLWILSVLEPEGIGATQPGPGSLAFAEGVDTQVVAFPDAGWVLERWLLDGEDAGYANPVNVPGGSAGQTQTLQAVFVPVVETEWTLSVSQPEGNGTTDPGAGDSVYGSGESAQARATPDEGWRFDHWLLDGGNAGSDNPLTVSPPDEGDTRTLQAVFVRQTWTLSILEPDGEGSTEPGTGGHAFHVGDAAQVAATPAAGWRFERWLLDGEDAGAGSPVTVESGADGETMELQAVFARQRWTLSVLEPAGEGTTAPSVGDHEYNIGETPEVTANPAEGWSLLHWEIDGESAGRDNPVSVASPADEGETRMVKAVFVDDTDPPSIVIVYPEHNTYNVPRHTLVEVRVLDEGVGVDPASVELQARLIGGDGPGRWETISDGGNRFDADGPVFKGVARRSGASSEFLYAFQPADSGFEFEDEVEMRIKASDAVGNETGWQEWSFTVETRSFGGSLRVDGGGFPNRHAAVCRDGEGTVWAVWERGRDRENGAVLIAPIKRGRIGEESFVLRAPTANRRRPVVAASDDTLWVAYEEYDRDAAAWAVRVARAPIALPLVWEPAPGDPAEGIQGVVAQSRPALAANPNGTVYLAFQAQREDGYLAAVSELPTGANAWQATVLDLGASERAEPTIATTNVNDAIAVWVGADGNLYGSNTPHWHPVAQITDGGGVSAPSLAVEETVGRVHLVWVQGADGNDIRYAKGPIVLPVAGVNVLDAPGEVFDAGAPSVAVVGSGEEARAFVFWHDRRSETPGDTDIRFAEIKRAGGFGTNVFVTTATTPELDAVAGTDARGNPFALWTDEPRPGRPRISFAGATRLVMADAPHTFGEGGGRHTFDVSDCDSFTQITLDVPAGVFPSEREVNVGEVSSPAGGCPGGMGVFFHVTPGAQSELSDWIKVTLHGVDPARVPSPPQVYRYVPETEEWTAEFIRRVSHNRAAQTLSFETKHLSAFGVGSRSVSEPSPSARSGGSGGGCAMAGSGPGDPLLVWLPLVFLALLVWREIRKRIWTKG